MEDRYYWIKLGDEWTIGEFDRYALVWTAIGTEEEIPCGSVTVIGEKIKPRKPFNPSNKIVNRILSSLRGK